MSSPSTPATVALRRPRGSGLRAAKRASERASRERRVARIHAMHEQVRVLSGVALTLPLLTDSDAVWDDFLDSDAKRIRALLRRLAPVVGVAQALYNEGNELRRLVRERQLVAKTVKAMIKQNHEDTWADDLRRWKALARLSFRPWTMGQCVSEVEASIERMRDAIASSDELMMERGFLGWDVWRRLACNGCVLEFLLQKVFRHFDLDVFVNMSWRVYTDPAIFLYVLHGNKGHAAMDVLQELSPTTMIIHFQERYDEAAATFHSLFLIARVDTDRGVTQIVRSIDVPELRQAIAGPCDLWTASNLWFQWLVVDPTKPRARTDFRMSFGGAIGADDPTYAQRWLLGVVAAIVQTEEAINGKPLIALTSSE